MNQQDSDSLRKFAYDSLGHSIVFEDFSRIYGRKTITWRITVPGKSDYYLKRHEHRSHYLAEVRALEEWTQCLPDKPWWSVPEVLTTEDELGAVIITSLPGLILEETRVESSFRTKLFQLAGRFAELLHSSRIDLSSESASQTYTDETLDRYLLVAEPHIDSATLKWIDSVVRRSDAWEGLAIVPTHCDFSPRNWLFREGKALLGIIDWERSRPGYFVEDFQRMIQDHWLLEPQLKDAFFAGYGREPSELEWRQANQVVLINAVTGVPWSISHGDSEFEQRNREVIERLKSVL
ncbi:MAG: aminoglycoside phosphotransferase family protein [Chloroflexi bacterium]|nr:aminoglycoside phosphotransferase family protein [Chloroflexota bacterium]